MTECINSLMKTSLLQFGLLEPAFEAYKKDINCMMTIYSLHKHDRVNNGLHHFSYEKVPGINLFFLKCNWQNDFPMKDLQSCIVK